VSIFHRLFGNGAAKTDFEKMSITEAEKIINAYGDALARRTSPLAELSGLPYPKAHIKTALLKTLAVTTDAKARDLLKAGYVTLAEWQEGAALQADPFALRENESTLEAARRISESGSSHLQLMERSAKEGATLLAELKARGY
jgi:hypothetical protein